MLRGESYKWMRSEKATPNIFSHLDEILAAGIVESFYVNDDNYWIGKTIGDLHLRCRTDATIIAIVRQDSTRMTPSAAEILKSGDTLVITGTHKAVDKAFELLSRKAETNN